MKNKVWKRLGALALCAALLCGGVLASNAARTIEVQYMDIKLVVDGVQVTPKDANGTVVEPFIYNGTTYLPVRAVGAALGKEVDWEGNTKTVYIGTIPGRAGENYLTPYETSYDSGVYSNDAAKHFTMMGKSYTQGFTVQYDSGYALFNLDGRYASIEFDVGHVDNKSSGESTLHILVDGKPVQDIELTGDMQTKHVSVPVNYGLQVKFVREGRWDGAYGIANLVGVE